MRGDDWLAERFEAHRDRLRAVAYRMLGSLAEADDAVQETWLRLSRSGADDIDNLAGWLTTVTGRALLLVLDTLGAPARRSSPRPTPGPSQAFGVVQPGMSCGVKDGWFRWPFIRRRSSSTTPGSAKKGSR
jgi:hypothetical protein